LRPAALAVSGRRLGWCGRFFWLGGSSQLVHRHAFVKPHRRVLDPARFLGLVANVGVCSTQPPKTRVLMRPSAGGRRALLHLKLTDFVENDGTHLKHELT
jgi:hypothetical protein